MRAHIDISEIETETKIRAKYLRALENEEWDLLPGPTFVKSFLRTYAEVLGLDAKLIVEEFKLRHERPSEFDLQPIRATNAGRERYKGPRPVDPPLGRRRAAGDRPRVALYALGTGGGGGSPRARSRPRRRPRSARVARRRRPAPRARRRRRPRPAEGRPADHPDRTGQRLPGRRRPRPDQEPGSQPGAKTRVYRAQKFDLTLGNNAVSLHVSGKLLKVPDSAPGSALS